MRGQQQLTHRAVLLASRRPSAPAARATGDRAVSTAPDERLARRLLDALLPPGAIVSAIYRPSADPAPWAAELVGRRIAWVVHPAQQRDLDPCLWAMTPHPFQPGSVHSARSVPLDCLREIEVIGSGGAR